MIRLYANEKFRVGAKIQLDPKEIRYFKTVRRAQSLPELFNREGQVAKGRLLDSEFEIEAVEEVKLPSYALHLAVAVPENSTVKQIIRQLSELGLERVSFFAGDRSQSGKSRLKALSSKLDALAIESARQCGRARPLEVSTPEFAELVASVKGARACVLDESPENSAPRASSPYEVIFIGPEGGWSPSERDFFIKQGFDRLHLPTPIMKVDTACACAAALSILQHSAP